MYVIHPPGGPHREKLSPRSKVPPEGVGLGWYSIQRQGRQGCTQRLTKGLPCPWAEIGKSEPYQININQIAGFVTMPSKKKNNHTY